MAAEVIVVANGNPFMFSGPATGWNKARHNWQHDLRKLFRDAGITSTGNMLSHRLAIPSPWIFWKRACRRGVSKLLGHESIKTTEKHYSKSVKGRQDPLDKLVTGTWAEGS